MPASLSPIETVPAWITLPGLLVVAVKAAEVAKTATPAIRARTATVRKIRSFLPSVSFVLGISPCSFRLSWA